MARLTAPKLTAIINGVPQYIPAGADSEAYELSRPDPVAGAQWARENYPGMTYDQAIARRYQEDLGPQNGGIAASTPASAPTMQAPTQVPTMQAPSLQQPTYAPSRLASQESGAIGAASIASQMPKTKPSAFAQAARPKPYRVQGGDTLSSIAKKNNMSLSQLLKLNPKFKQQAKYKGGNTIFRNTAVNLTKPTVKKKPGAFSGMNTTSPGQFRRAEERSMQQATPTLKNPLGGM